MNICVYVYYIWVYTYVCAYAELVKPHIQKLDYLFERQHYVEKGRDIREKTMNDMM